MSVQRCPEVYRAINRITAEFARAGIPKLHTNIPDQYQYRSIDDLTARLAPLLARHRLCVIPRVLKHRVQDRQGQQESLLVSVSLLAAFDVVSARDGSSHTVQCWGEALDGGDKGTAKAMSSAYKCAMLELFCVPVGNEDADGSGHRLKQQVRESEPVQGWSSWTGDIVEMIHGCETVEAVDRVRCRHRNLLEALKREQPGDYAVVGRALKMRGEQLAQARSRPAQDALDGKDERSAPSPSKRTTAKLPETADG